MFAQHVLIHTALVIALFSSAVFSAHQHHNKLSCCAQGTAHWVSCATFGENIGNGIYHDHDDLCIHTTRCLHASHVMGSCLPASLLFAFAFISGSCCHPSTALLLETILPGTLLCCPCANYASAAGVYWCARCLEARSLVEEIDYRRRCPEDADCNPRAIRALLKECFGCCLGNVDTKKNNALLGTGSEISASTK